MKITTYKDLIPFIADRLIIYVNRIKKVVIEDDNNLSSVIIEVTDNQNLFDDIVKELVRLDVIKIGIENIISSDVIDFKLLKKRNRMNISITREKRTINQFITI